MSEKCVAWERKRGEQYYWRLATGRSKTVKPFYRAPHDAGIYGHLTCYVGYCHFDVSDVNNVVK